jgi:aspartate-semialdehyde dehydrogenase
LGEASGSVGFIGEWGVVELRKLSVAVLGATGAVGQRICDMLRGHPWFKVTTLTGGASAGKRYGEAVNWLLPTSVPEKLRDAVVEPSAPGSVEADLVFSALPSGVARRVEPMFAEAGFPVVSNASAFRMEKDVPLVVPEVNPDHTRLLEAQRRGRGWRGFIATDPNCSTINFALALKPLHDLLDIRKVVVTTMQAVSGAGYPGLPSLDIMGNVIPYIGGEEEKMETEPLKILGILEDGVVKDASFALAASCNRVPVIDGHMEAIYLEAGGSIDLDEVREAFKTFKGGARELRLPTSPDDPIILRDEEDRPQTRLDRLAGSVPGMSVSVGRVRHGVDRSSLRFVALGHNTIRGAAGGAISLAELLVAKGYI